MKNQLYKGFSEKDYSKVKTISKQFSSFAYLKQVHGNKILYADREGLIGRGDGLYTDKKELILTIRVADCNAIYLWSRQKKLVMLLHAGWRGTIKNILQKGIDIFYKNSIKKNDIQIYFSPSARKCCYEIGKDLYTRLKKNDNAVVEQKSERYYFDMLETNLKIAKKNGIEKISYSKDCTICNNNYFSYRENQTSKRHLAFIGIKRSKDEE